MRPDVMEGVPEEPGYYLVKNAVGNDEWLLCRGDKQPDGRIKFTAWTDDGPFRVATLGRRKFSERIQPPTEQEYK